MDEWSWPDNGMQDRNHIEVSGASYIELKENPIKSMVLENWDFRISGAESQCPIVLYHLGFESRKGNNPHLVLKGAFQSLISEYVQYYKALQMYLYFTIDRDS